MTKAGSITPGTIVWDTTTRFGERVSRKTFEPFGLVRLYFVTGGSLTYPEDALLTTKLGLSGM